MRQEYLTKEDTYNCSLTNEVQSLASQDLKEDPVARKKALFEVRKWIKSQSHIKRVRMDSSFILRFLRMQKYDVAETCTILDKYLTMRNQFPAWFQNLDYKDSSLEELVDSGYIFVLPERDSHGRRIIFSKAGVFDSSKFTTSDMVRVHIMTFETLLNDEENQVRGFTYVFDEKNIGWNHVSLWTPSEITKAFGCCERALPMRHQEVHFINMPWTMNVIFQFAKGLLSEKIRSRFQTHSSLEGLHKQVDPSLLPKEYGGNRTTEECVRLWKQELEASRDSLKQLDQMKVAGFDGPTNEPQVSRKKSRHASGSQMIGMMANIRKMEVTVDQAQ